MKLYEILFGILLAMSIAFFIISSYSLYDKCIDCNHLNKNKDRVRCPPKYPKQKPTRIVLNENKKTANISIYQEDSIVKNKGFINELMYKPVDNNIDYKFQNNEITNPSIPLNDLCDTKNLPIANVNINFLLKNKDAKLIL